MKMLTKLKKKIIQLTKYSEKGRRNNKKKSKKVKNGVILDNY